MESGWSADQQGYVHYAFALRNTSKTQQVQYPQITITGRAKDGSIVFSQTQALNMAFPNQTVYDAGQAGEGTAPATVDFVVLSPDTYNVTEAQGTATFPISGTSKIDNRDGGTTFNGEVRAVADGFKPSDGQQIKISLVLRNAQNAIIYGDIAFRGLAGQWPIHAILDYRLRSAEVCVLRSVCANLVVDFTSGRWPSGACQAAVRVTCALTLRRAWPNR